MSERAIELLLSELDALGYWPVPGEPPSLVVRTDPPARPKPPELEAEWPRRWPEIVAHLAVEAEIADAGRPFVGWTTHDHPIGDCAWCGAPSRTTDRLGRPLHTICLAEPGSERAEVARPRTPEEVAAAAEEFHQSLAEMEERLWHEAQRGNADPTDPRG